MNTNKTQETIRFILQCYGFRALDEDMLQKMVYLSDFVACSKLNQQMTESTWHLTLSGPYSPEVGMLLGTDSALRTETIDAIRLVRLSTFSVWSNVAPSLSEEEKSILKSVVDSAKEMYAGDFLRLVASTYEFARAMEPGKQISLTDLVEQYSTVRKWLQTSSTKSRQKVLVPG